MGKIAKQYWLNADNDELIEKEKRLGFKRSAALGYLGVESWTILTAAVLLTEDQQPRKSSARQIDKLVDLLETQIIDETPSRSINKVFSFRGHKTKARGNFVNLYSLKLAFPVKAFFEFAMSELFPNEKQGQDLPCFGIFHDLAKETEGQDVIEPIEPEFAMALTRLGCKHPLLIAEPMPQKDVPPWEQLPMSQDQTEQLGEAPDDQAIIEGLTVADVRAMCAHSTPLKSILIATANWHKIPNGYQQKRDDTALETLLSQQAKIDRWGTANDNGVAKEDLPILKRYITGNVKGRGKK